MKNIGLALSLALLFNACIAAAAVGAGYVLSERVRSDGTQEARVQDDADHVWEVVRESLELLHDPNSQITLKSAPRRASAVIDLNLYEVEVQAFRDTILLVKSDSAVSAAQRKKVLDYILTRLAKSREAGGS